MKKRVLYLHRTQANMAEGEHIRGVIYGFRELGYEVDCIGPPGIEVDSKKNAVTQSTVRSPKKELWRILADYVPQIIFEGLEFGFNLYGYYRLNQAFQKNDYDMIYERYALNTFYSGWFAQKKKIPMILEVNDATVIERSRPLILKGISRKIEKRIFDRATLIVTITEHFKQRIISEHRIDPGKIVVTPNAVNPHRFRLDPSRLLSKKAMGIHAAHVIGCVGAFVPWHGLEFMVKTLHQAVLTHDIHMLFVGDGPVRNDVENFAERYGISDKLTFTGFVESERVPYYIDLMDICVIPGSNPHCSPVKLFEYMAMGKPIVLPKFSPLLDTIDHGCEGLFFEPNDSECFKNLVTTLIMNESLRLKMGKNAAHSVYTKYTWDKNVQKILTELNLQMKR